VTKNLLLLAAIARCAILDFEDIGGVPDSSSLDTVVKNGRLLNQTLNNATFLPGDVLVFPNKTFHIMGGIIADNLDSVTISFDGTIVLSNDLKHWPRSSGSKVLECFLFNNAKNLTLTSSGKGLIDGNGGKWWGIPGIGYLVRQENRPRLMRFEYCSDLTVENLILKNSPYWTFFAGQVNGLTVRYTDIDVRRTNIDRHDIIDLTAFNTDGFDVTGRNVHIHDCNVWNQDDSIAVKDDSQDMLFERVNVSGLGLAIGSISGSIVRNITFRDCYLHHTFKGIYMKFRDGEKPGFVEDITYENIVMDEPEQWPIWIGPAQQSDSNNLCAAHPCSICWPHFDFKCNMPKAALYRNVTLRNVLINNPKSSPGVILGNADNPMQNILFDNVVVKGAKKGSEDYHTCVGSQGIATGGTYPVPNCFKEVDN